MFSDFVDELNVQAEKRGLGDSARGVQGSMDRLNVELESVDLIWCEGTIDGVGFEEMPGCWNSFLKPNGYVAVTCPSWFIDDRVAEIDDFWTEAGSGPDTVAQNVDVLQKAESLGSFWSKTAYWEKKTRSLSRPWSTRLNLGKFFRRSGTMTLSATFLTWGNSRAVLLLARAFAAYCGKRRKMACERYKEFSQQGIFDHGVGRARARLEWEAFCQSPCLQGFGGDSLDEWVERRVGWRLRAWSLFACAAQRRMSIGVALLR